MAVHLPWMGLGLSTNVGARAVPHPYRLLDQHPGLFDFVEYSAPLDLEEARRAPLFAELEARRSGVPLVLHPVHLNLYGPEPESPAALAALAAHAKALGSPWIGNDVGWWHQGGAPFPGHLYFPPPMDLDGLANAAHCASTAQAALPVPLLLENPSVLVRQGSMHVLDFMAELHGRTQLGLLLDLGHLLSYQLTWGLPPDAGLDGFPLDQVIEIHLAGGVVTSRAGRQFFVDDHTQPVQEELFALLAQVLPRCTRLRALTFEGDGHPPAMAARTLERLRPLLPLGRDAHAEAPLPSPPREQPLTELAWNCFDRAYGGVVDEDPEGQAMDTDFRLAVVAEQLDRVFPWSRLLLAGDRAALLDFTGSSEFRSQYEGLQPELGQVFARWARRRLRDKADEGLAKVFAFETWALHLRSHVGSPELAPGTRLGTFACDLSELQFAVQSLRRHLNARAQVNERWESSGLAVLRQVVARAPLVSWHVALRQHGAGTEIIGLPPDLGTALQKWLRGAELSPLVRREAMQLGILDAVTSSEA